MDQSGHPLRNADRSDHQLQVLTLIDPTSRDRRLDDHLLLYSTCRGLPLQGTIATPPTHTPELTTSRISQFSDQVRQVSTPTRRTQSHPSTISSTSLLTSSALNSEPQADLSAKERSQDPTAAMGIEAFRAVMVAHNTEVTMTDHPMEATVLNMVIPIQATGKTTPVDTATREAAL